MPKKERRTVLITGVTRGLGRAMTEKFIELGHTVLGCGRSVASVEAMRKTFPKPHDFQPVDTSSDGAVAQWAQGLLKVHPVPELIVNNAAVINPNGPLWGLTAEEVDPVIDVNLKGVINVIRHFLPAMIEAGRGIIVNFSSGWGRSVSPEVAPYCATKWAIEGLSKALAEELPRGLACMPVNPGIINTEMLQSAFGRGASHYPSPEEWAEKAVPFLLKLEAKENGKSLSV